MNVKKIALSIFKTKRRTIAFVVVLAGVIIGGICAVTYNYTPKTDTTSLNKLLLEASDLTTAKLKITNMTEYKDKGIKILNRSDFIMVYEATVWAGIDVQNIKIIPDDVKKVIRINIPKAKIQDAKVDSATIKYFDEHFALFNVNEKEDANKAVELAEKSVKEEAVNTGILELADKQSATLIEGLLSKGIPDGYKIEAKVVE